MTPIRLGAIGIVTYIGVVTHQLRKPSPPSRSLAPERNWRRGPTVGVTTHRFRLADFVNRHTRTPVGVVTHQFRLVPPPSPYLKTEDEDPPLGSRPTSSDWWVLLGALLTKINETGDNKRTADFGVVTHRFRTPCPLAKLETETPLRQWTPLGSRPTVSDGRPNLSDYFF